MTREVLAPLRDMALGLRDEWQSRAWRHPRNVHALRQVASVALAVLACHALGLADSWWAAISAFTVMQAGWRTTLARAGLRGLGTLAGALLGWLLGPWLAPHAAAFVLAVGLIAWLCLYGALAFAQGYAWVLGLVTFVMVVCEARTVSAATVGMAGAAALAEFARVRVFDVAIGSLACVCVAVAADALGARLGRRGGQAGVALPISAVSGSASGADVAVLRRNAAHLALHCAFAVAALALACTLTELRHLTQAMVTTIAVLVVPVEGLVAATRRRVAQRMAQRAAGCLLAIALAAAVLPWVEGRPLAAHVALAAGVWCAAWLQEGAASVRYMALQFGVAFIMVFVQDPGTLLGEAPALQRMAGIGVGIAVLALSMGLAAVGRAAWLGRGRATG
ncbi:FUSC family protein [Variovorax sp. J22G73]|uniref:FUSC family protein n=1 Tax=unclassified Variovorax TaxID=663243 RepID=UPI002577BFB2|nr:MULTISPECIES: FUSC family protein [unclassified Variovorax]MDM0005771.1 FUSC family protein [Variovorax sp. J22R203]MDM0099798.1 FUSC family protein [Variovorax sp. J22G73]